MLIETCYGFPVKLRVGPNKSCFRQEMNTFCGKEISRKIWGLMVKVVGGELPMWRNHHKPDQRTYSVKSTTNRASLRPAFHSVLSQSSLSLGENKKSTLSKGEDLKTSRLIQGRTG